MRYQVKLNGNVDTDFACERSFIERVVRNFGCAETDLDDMVYEVGEEIASHVYGEFEELCDAGHDGVGVETLEYEGEGDWSIAVSGWLTDTIMLTTGAPIAESLREVIGAVLLAEFHMPAEYKTQPIELVA